MDLMDIKVTEWTILADEFETAEDAPRFATQAAAERFMNKFEIDGLVVGLVPTIEIS